MTVSQMVDESLALHAIGSNDKVGDVVRRARAQAALEEDMALDVVSP